MHQHSDLGGQAGHEDLLADGGQGQEQTRREEDEEDDSGEHYNLL